MTFLSDNEEVVKVVEEHNLTIGFNPFHYTSINFELKGVNVDNMYVDDIIDKLLEKQCLCITVGYMFSSDI